MSIAADDDEIYRCTGNTTLETAALDILRTIVDYGECTGDCEKIAQQAQYKPLVCVYCRSKKLLLETCQENVTK